MHPGPFFCVLGHTRSALCELAYGDLEGREFEALDLADGKLAENTN